MGSMLGMCGCDCGACPSFRGNLKTAADRRRLSAGWEKYLGAKLSPEKLRPCDGCSIPDERRKSSYTNCRVRRCAIHNGVRNCAYCSAYPCEDLLGVHGLQREDGPQRIEERVGGKVPQADYLAFIKPYEGIKHLNRVRESLAPEELVAMRPVSVGARAAPFPANLKLTAARQAPYRRIHQLISTLEVHQGISYARKLVLTKRRRQLLRLLWAVAHCGEWKTRDKACLLLDGRTYLAQKISSMHAQLVGFCEALAEHGVSCELIEPPGNPDWLTPTGGLRRREWKLRVSCADSIGGYATLRALVNYTALLEQRFGDKAYRRFARAEMSVLA